MFTYFFHFFHFCIGEGRCLEVGTTSNIIVVQLSVSVVVAREDKTRHV
jgi:hypothetical protein